MKYTFPSGTYYEGDMVDEMFQGIGMLHYECGDKYSGEFSVDMFEGNGVYTYTSGSSYTGPFVNDLFHGVGTFAYADGSVEKGKFHQDKRVGKFYQFDTATRDYYELIYQNDKVQTCKVVSFESIPEEKRP